MPMTPTCTPGSTAMRMPTPSQLRWCVVGVRSQPASICCLLTVHHTHHSPSTQLPIGPCMHDASDEKAARTACDRCKSSLSIELKPTPEKCAFGAAVLPHKDGKDSSAAGTAPGGKPAAPKGGGGGAFSSLEERVRVRALWLICNVILPRRAPHHHRHPCAVRRAVHSHRHQAGGPDAQGKRQAVHLRWLLRPASRQAGRHLLLPHHHRHPRAGGGAEWRQRKEVGGCW